MGLESDVQNDRAALKRSVCAEQPRRAGRTRRMESSRLGGQLSRNDHLEAGKLTHCLGEVINTWEDAIASNPPTCQGPSRK